MERSGRRPGLALGYGLAFLGTLLGMVGVTIGSFALLLGGMALFGVSQTSNLLSRYAAADVSGSGQRGGGVPDRALPAARPPGHRAPASRERHGRPGARARASARRDPGGRQGADISVLITSAPNSAMSAPQNGPATT